MTSDQEEQLKRTKLDDAKARFSKALSNGLLKKTGKIPTANALANQFNYRAVGMPAVSRETTRKWLSGQSIPEVAKLIVLVDWLGLDANEFMSSHAFKPKPNDDGVMQTLCELVHHMDEKTQTMVLITAWSLRQAHGLHSQKFDLPMLKRMLTVNLNRHN